MNGFFLLLLREGLTQKWVVKTKWVAECLIVQDDIIWIKKCYIWRTLWDYLVQPSFIDKEMEIQRRKELFQDYTASNCTPQMIYAYPRE